MLFADRQEAGERLASKLLHLKGKSPLILAVPRGGLAVAQPVLEKIGGELDLIITRKIGAPFQPELAIGAVTGDGFIMLNEDILSRVSADSSYIEKAAAEEVEEIKRRLKTYRGDRPSPAIDKRIVVLIDDGVATGYTLLAALRSLQEKKPERLILAVPVGPPDTFKKLQQEVDELVYIEAPANFAAVGQFYRRFDQVSDAEVSAVLRKAWQV